MKRHCWSEEDRIIGVQFDLEVPAACGQWYAVSRDGATTNELCKSCLRLSGHAVLTYGEYEGFVEGGRVVNDEHGPGTLLSLFSSGTLMVGVVQFDTDRTRQPRAFSLHDLAPVPEGQVAQ